MTRRLAALSIVCLLSAIALWPAADLRAATALYFDAEGGTKWWDYVALNWSDDPGGSYNRVWADGSDAYFEGTGGTVNVSGPISTNSLIFAADAYWIFGTYISIASGEVNVVNQNDVATMSVQYMSFANGNGLRKLGNGTLSIHGFMSYSAPTIIDAGVLMVGNHDDALPTNKSLTLANVAGAAFNLNNYRQTVASLSGGGSLGGNILLGAAGTGRLTVGDSSSTTYGGSISGSGHFIKQGSGTLTLTGANVYTGTTTIGGGTIRLSGGDDRLPTGTALSLNGTTLDLNNQNQTIGSLAGTGNVLLGSGTLTVAGSASTTFSGSISGTGGLVKQGSGTWTLSTWNSSGPIVINGGILRLANPIPYPLNTTVY